MLSVIVFPLGDHNVVSGYLLFPSKSVLFLASWCVDLSDACDCWRLLFPFSHFMAIASDYLLIIVDVLWRLWRIC